MGWNQSVELHQEEIAPVKFCHLATAVLSIPRDEFTSKLTYHTYLAYLHILILVLMAHLWDFAVLSLSTYA